MGSLYQDKYLREKKNLAALPGELPHIYLTRAKVHSPWPCLRDFINTESQLFTY